jgi:hypothetical protein
MARESPETSGRSGHPSPMTIHIFGEPGDARTRNLFDLLARPSDRNPALAVSAYSAGDRRGRRVSFTVPGGDFREAKDDAAHRAGG